MVPAAWLLFNRQSKIRNHHSRRLAFIDKDAEKAARLCRWRGELIAPWLGFDASISPVAGARITGNLIQGSAYVGISPAVGLYVRCTRAIDVGLSYQPVVNLFHFGGAEEVRNKTYHDIVLSISFRSFTEVKKLDWE